MNTSEYRNEKMGLTFRYGMFNPDYPNRLRRNSFALDYDCYSLETFDDANEIIRYIERAHGMIQNLFEKSITENMRKAMK